MGTILVAEDDERVRELFSQCLKVKGYRVVEARDGQEVLKLARQQPFDLIVMDVKMPKMDGLAALRQLRGSMPSAKVILITGYRVTQEMEAMLQDGIVEYLQKPVTLTALTELIERMADEGQDAQSAGSS